MMPPRPQAARHLGEHRPPIADVLQHAGREDQIKAGVAKRQRGRNRKPAAGTPEPGDAVASRGLKGSVVMNERQYFATSEATKPSPPPISSASPKHRSVRRQTTPLVLVAFGDCAPRAKADAHPCGILNLLVGPKQSVWAGNYCRWPYGAGACGIPKSFPAIGVGNEPGRVHRHGGPMRSEIDFPSPQGHHNPKAPGAPDSPPQNKSCPERTPPYCSARARAPGGAPANGVGAEGQRQNARAGRARFRLLIDGDGGHHALEAAVITPLRGRPRRPEFFQSCKQALPLWPLNSNHRIIVRAYQGPRLAPLCGVQRASVVSEPPMTVDKAM